MLQIAVSPRMRLSQLAKSLCKPGCVWISDESVNISKKQSKMVEAGGDGEVATHLKPPRKEGRSKVFLAGVGIALVGVAHGLWRAVDLLNALYLMGKFEELDPWWAKGSLQCSIEELRLLCGLGPADWRTYYFGAALTRAQTLNPQLTLESIWVSVAVILLGLAIMGVAYLQKIGLRVRIEKKQA